MSEGKNVEKMADSVEFSPILPSARAKLREKCAQNPENLTNRDFVHLHNHTNYSVLDGLTKVPELIEITKNFGQDAVAMTDHGTLSGWLDFYKTAKSGNVKPILGIETYVAARGHEDRDPTKDKNRYHLTLLAQNQTGYKNLMKLSSIANLEGVYYKPRIDHELLKKYNAGTICLSGCASGEIGENLREGNYEKAREIAKWYREIFGDRYFIEVQDHGHPDAPKHWEVQTKINEGALKIAAELNIPAVVTCDAHYAKIEDTDAHEILLCVGTGSFLSDKNRMSLADFHLHVTDPAEIIARWGKDYPDVILNARKIADFCNVEIKTGDILIPKFPIDEKTREKLLKDYEIAQKKLPEKDQFEFNEDKELLDLLVYRGLAWRYGAAPADNKLTVAEARKILPAKILERAEYEMSVIDKMGYNGYFLIVSDFIGWGKSRGIVFGPGRGSAAGSVVAYALKITELDPLEFDLLFERFLNPDRVSMPDIDIDIQDTRRDEILQYCVEKYGSQRVSNIATFGTMASRAAVKDVARVLEVPFAEANRLSALVPPPAQGHYQSLADAIKTDADFRAEYENNPTSHKVIDFAIRLEGTIRSHGVHAAGTVIAPDDLVKFIPLEMAQKGVVATQWPGPQVEEVGLLKMDFLGLSNLSIINNCLRIIRKVYGENVNLSNVPMTDEKTYQLFQNAETIGVFQFESAGMQRYMRELHPTKFEDLIAMNALYRPGPMSEIPKFIARAHGEEEITYDDPHMEPALKSTYGVLVYQEQFMQIAKDMANFTGGEADFLRKAISKKKIDLMREYKQKFIDGAVKISGANRAKMEKFWDHLEDFASYCFNKSHAACYSLVGYWTAYLKAHFPAAFMAALMTSDANNIDRLAIEIAECNRLGLKVLNPDINESFPEFAVVPETENIRFGLSAVKNVGSTAIDDLIAQRAISKFENVEDFARRCNSRVCNRKVWEALIKAGAFDNFAKTIPPENDDDIQIFGDRSDLLFNLDNIISFAQKVQKEAASGQEDLFGLLTEKVAGAETHLEISPAPTKVSDSEKLGWERELLGLYLSAHPLDKYDVYFREQTHAIAKINSNQDGARAEIGGILNKFRAIVTKSGGKMAFAAVEDKTGEIEVVIFPSLFESLPEDLSVGAIVKIVGKISGKDRDGNVSPAPSIIADELQIIRDENLQNYVSTGVEKGEIDLLTRVKTSRKNYKNRAENAGFSGGNSGNSGNNFGGNSGGNLANYSGNSYKNSAQNSTKFAQNSTNFSTNNSAKKSQNSAQNYVPAIEISPKLYVHIKDPSDGARLLKLKDEFKNFAGDDEVILVLGEQKKDAVKLPFRTKICEDLTAKIGEIYGEKCVAVK